MDILSQEQSSTCFQMLYGKWKQRGISTCVHSWIIWLISDPLWKNWIWILLISNPTNSFWNGLTNARSVLRSEIRFWFRRKEHTLSWIAQNIQDIAHKKPISSGLVYTYWCYLLIKITNKQCRCCWLGFPFPALCNCLKLIAPVSNNPYFFFLCGV